MKQEIKYKSMNVFISHKNTVTPSLLFNCTKIVYQHDIQNTKEFPNYIDHHIYFYNNKDKLIFKVWLDDDKKYKNIKEALKNVGIKFVKKNG